MPNSKQRREVARRRLERQLERRQHRDVRRRQTTMLATVIGTLVILAVVIVAVVMLTNDKTKTPTASGTSAATGDTVACTYTAQEAASNPNLKDVGTPPNPATTPAKGTQNVTMVTSRGEIDIQLNRASAPCSVASWDYLISKKFYNNTPCHRLVNSGIFVLQCGDPSGTGAGGATYQYAEENLDKVSYGAGVIAMAKTATPATTGSQFFIIYQDSNAGLSKDYSVVGAVTKGLDIVKAVAAGGLAANKTAPKLPIKITSVTVAN